MKDQIHPNYYTNAKVTCACGNTFELGSTKEELFVEVCSNCHPFYTGEEALVDTAGRVEQFRKRMEKKEAIQRERQTAQKHKNASSEASEDTNSTSDEDNQEEAA